MKMNASDDDNCANDDKHGDGGDKNASPWFETSS